jgi:3D (Asp-Asp-Asp) domain-containing protein
MQGSGFTTLSENPVLKYYSKQNTFKYVQKVTGCVGRELQANHSIAVDPEILPFRHKVMVYFPSKAVLGLRHAEDKGDRIIGHHFDLFMPNEAERDKWRSAHGGTINGAFVKYIGL